jgi:hypothetical protein
MEYAGIDSSKLLLVENMNDLSKTIKEKTTGDIYSMNCFDKEIEIKKIIKEDCSND